MTNISMKSPPLLGVIPPDESLDTAVIRLAFYDDDGKPAEMTAALEAGLQAYATIPTEAPDLSSSLLRLGTPSSPV